MGIGASAGGLEAFTELVRNLPIESEFAYVLVQHLDPTHRSLLSELLGRSATLPVREIEPNTTAEPNQIYVIPPNCDLTIQAGVLKLTPRDKKPGPARSIDHFLRSLAADQGPNAIGVILSGAGSDGAKGLKAVKEAGGVTFAQDETSSKYDSMPRSAITAGCVDFVLPPEKIAEELARMISKPGKTRSRAAANARNRRGLVSRKGSALDSQRSAPEAWPAAPKDADLRKIFLIVRTRTGLDFSVYRPNTIRRRLRRRLSLHKLRNLSEYHRYLRENPDEAEALYQDLLINVTSFFRNPTVFETLKKKVFPRLVKMHGDGDLLRMWIAGCSTGQEAYSYAIAFTEFCEKASLRVPIQIFATDVNAAVLEQARSGRYTKAQLEGLSAARVQRYFKREHDSYRIIKPIRDMVIFAQQNLLTDPPFTRVDLISCRNMLIYIEPALQQKVLPVFHYALRAHGALVLGSSESIGTFTNLFSPLEKAQKIYAKKSGVSRVTPERPAAPALLRSAGLNIPRREPEMSATDAYREADRLTLARYAPPGVLVNDDGEILQFRGKVQPFIEIPSGKATLNLLKMARGSLALSLQKGLHRARTERRAVREKAVSFEGPRQTINLEFIPVKSMNSRCFLILFEKVVSPPKAAPMEEPRPSARGSARAESQRYSELKREFAETRSHLETLREQHETAVEELQASNEEVQSSNEELQSLNEELETSNEELESANEELTTLNEELSTRNSELRESEQRLREQAQLVELAPLLARSAKDRIIFWNVGAERLYGFSKEEALGQTSHLLLGAQYAEPLDRIQASLHEHGRWEGEVVHRRKDGGLIHVSTQWVVSLDDTGRTRAVLEINTDVTARRRAEESLRKAQELNQRVLESTPDCIMVLDLAGRLSFLNGGGKRVLEVAEIHVGPGAHWTALWSAEWRQAADTAYRSAVVGTAARFQALSDSRVQPRWWDVVIQPILDGAGHPEQLLAVCRDITERRDSEMLAMEEARMAAMRAEVAVEVARGGDLGPILQQIAHIIMHQGQVAHVRLWLAQEAPPALRLQASAGHAPLSHEKNVLAIGQGRIGSIAASKRPYHTDQVADDADLFDPDWVRRENIISFAGYPLLFEGQLLGVLSVASRDRIPARLLRELGLAADSIALLIQRKLSDDERNRLLQQAMDARNEALAASRAKDDFLATLSHELRTPLNPVLLLASDGADNPDLPPAVRSTFETIRNNVVLEARLIDDLLDLTRIAHGKLALEFKPVDMNIAVREAVRIVSATVDPTTLTIEQKLEASPSQVLGDSVRLQQVLWNVLNNAVKFTPTGGRITISTTTLPTQHVRIQVRDTGIGLKPKDLANIFDTFSQVERRKGGLGLGLAITRQLLEKHHGTIRALSDGPGHGSTFEIDLPLMTGPAPSDGLDGKPPRFVVRSPTAPRLIDGKPAPRPKLLLVEDHASTRKALRSLLINRNFDVVAASSLSEARARMETESYDLVISDLGLPDGDGYTLAAELRSKRPGVVAIALSGYGTEDDRARSRAAGFVNHLTKPVSIAALDQVIAESMRRQPGEVADGTAP